MRSAPTTLRCASSRPVAHDSIRASTWASSGSSAAARNSARALANAPWRDLLPRDLAARGDELSAESLRALIVLVREAGVSEATGTAPQAEALAPVLAELGAQGQQGATRWERFKRWLEQKLENRDDDEEGVLDKWSRQLQTSEGVAQAITYLGYALVAGLVIFVIAAELRAAGLLSVRRRAAERAHPASMWRRRLMLADVAAAPLAERPGMLLRLLGESLTRAHRLPAADGLTASAIARRADLEDAGDRERIDAHRDGRRRGALCAALAGERCARGSGERGEVAAREIRASAGATLMRERGITLLLALAALAAFYGMWLRPTPTLDPDADTARPSTAERRGNGYAALFAWLESSGVAARSFRERYTALPELGIAPRGNLLVLSLPGVEVFNNEEFSALDAVGAPWQYVADLRRADRSAGVGRGSRLRHGGRDRIAHRDRVRDAGRARAAARSDAAVTTRRRSGCA